jgi:hypothetical protein
LETPNVARFNMTGRKNCSSFVGVAVLIVFVELFLVHVTIIFCLLELYMEPRDPNLQRDSADWIACP